MPEQVRGPQESFGIQARRILNAGPGALGPLPPAAEIEALSAEEALPTLIPLRVELYAISSIIAEEAVGRSLEAKPSFPPYGLLRSLFSDFRVISASPSPISEGSLTDFRLLGKALIDTMVFHLDAHLNELRKSERQWLPERLGRLLALFRLGADRQAQARMRDAFSFIYGGLQFGTSTCVQLAEVMSRVLDSSKSLSPHEKAEVMKRSIRPAYDLASLNVEDVAPAYAKLQPPEAGADPGSPQNPAGWMDPGRFEIRFSEGKPSRIVLAVDLEAEFARKPGHEAGHKFPTQGCPARLAPSSNRSPIGRLWEWSVDLAEQTGLL